MKQQIRFCRSFDGTRIAFAIATGYIFIGIFFEERALAAAHGRSFEPYRRQVSMILPVPRKSEADKRAVNAH